MADKSGIEWTDASWNPTTGCDIVSPGCTHCYARTLSPRLQAMAIGRGETDPTAPYMRDGDPKTSGVGFGLLMHESKLDQPLRWTRARRIFVNSMSDLFHPEVTDDFLDKVFAVMAMAPQHTFQVLTKRPERMRAYLTSANETVGDVELPARQRNILFAAQALVNAGVARRGSKVSIVWPLPNVWVGTSVENARWRTRIDELRLTPAAVRFLSCEPLLGPLVCPECKGWGYDVAPDPSDPTGQTAMQVPCPGIDGWHGDHDLNLSGIDWAIVGGESGPGARPMDLEWVRDIVARCLTGLTENSTTHPFVKQLGDVWSRENLGHPGHGGDIETFPADLQVREYPA